MNGWDEFNDFGRQSFFEEFITGMPVFFKIMFLIVIAFFVFVIVKMVRVWMSNNASPLVTAYCSAVAKRSEVWGGSGDSSASTSYYVTFELENGERVELQVPNRTYGLIVEGDEGELFYQGTRFKEFQRSERRARQ